MSSRRGSKTYQRIRDSVIQSLGNTQGTLILLGFLNLRKCSFWGFAHFASFLNLVLIVGYMVCNGCYGLQFYHCSSNICNIILYLLIGRQRKGTSPSHFCRGAGGVARKALQSLEGLKLIEKTGEGGRKLTVQGRRDLDRIAAQVRPKKTPVVPPPTVITA